MSDSHLPNVLADVPLLPSIMNELTARVNVIPWSELNDSIDAIYTYGHPTVDAAMLDRAPRIRVISNFGVGVDHIDVRAASERGIPVGNTPGILDGATADMAFALLLATGRRLVEGDQYARSPEFTRYDPSYMLGREIHGATLGIFGLGRIGAQIARRAKAFEMQVIYHNRRQRPDVERELGVRYVSKDELLQSSDYVLLTVPLTAETRHFIGKDELQMMKPTASLINVARGPVVNTEALTEALTQRTICSAGLDVTDPEPLPRDHPLLKLSNVIITPHLGSATEQTRQQMAELSLTNLFAGLEGHSLECQVTPG